MQPSRGVNHSLVLTLLLAACAASEVPTERLTDAASPTTADSSAPSADARMPDTDGGAPETDSGRAVDESRFAALSEAVIADLEANRATGASVAVWIDGEVIWVNGFGTIDSSTPGGPARAPGEDTLFMIGSDTKKLTALSLLQQVQAGVLSLDTTVAEVLPDLQMAYAPDFARATVRQLLSHQSGIVDGAEMATTTSDAALEAYAFGEFASGYYPLASPGRFWNYCNPGYSIAGLVDQRVDGRMYPDILEQDLFAPLGMRRTFARKSELDADFAPGNGYGGDPADTTEGPVPFEELWDSGFSRPAGLVWSTPSDQMRLAAFLVDGNADVLAPELLRELVTPQVNTYPDLPGDYGLGISVEQGLHVGERYYDVPVWYHGGDTLSHSSTFYILPEQRFAISILSNAGGDSFITSVLAAIESLVDLPAPSAAPPIPFEPAALDALTGTYVDEFNLGDVIVTRAGDTLQVDMPALNAAAIPYRRVMDPITTRVWLTEVAGEPADIAFIDGPEGETYFRSRGFVAIRWPADGAARRSARAPALTLPIVRSLLRVPEPPSWLRMRARRPLAPDRARPPGT